MVGEDMGKQVVEPLDAASLLCYQKVFGYTAEDLKSILDPMAQKGIEPTGSMGNDTPPAVLSRRPSLVYDYFKQLFAQVTNPPIDSIREEIIMSLECYIGPEQNLLYTIPEHAHRLRVPHPILTNVDLERIRRIENHVDNAFRTKKLSICYPAGEGASGMRGALQRLCERATDTVREGHNIIILSDRCLDVERVAIPALLATAAVHHHLIREGLRTEVGLVVETGEARDIFEHPVHPYTQGLLWSIPKVTQPKHTRLNAIPGRPPRRFRWIYQIHRPWCNRTVPWLLYNAASR